MNTLKTKLSFAALGLSILALSGCGTTVGNGATASVTVASKAYNSTTADLFRWSPLRLLNWLVQDAFAGTITSFKFCVTKFRLDASDDSTIGGPGSSDGSFTQRLGLIDLGHGTTDITWGNADLPVTTAVRRFRIELHKDKDTCSGADYSVSVNGQTIQKDLEFKFIYATPKLLQNGTSVRFSMAKLTQAFAQAVLAGAFNDSDIGQYFDASDPAKSAEDSAD